MDVGGQGACCAFTLPLMRGDRRPSEVPMSSEGQEIAASVARNGWAAVSIPSSPFGPFVYSVGVLTTVGHPELIVFGLDPDTGYSVLAAMVQDIRNGSSQFSPVLVLSLGGVATDREHL